jgi:hypothetical protein
VASLRAALKPRMRRRGAKERERPRFVRLRRRDARGGGEDVESIPFNPHMQDGRELMWRSLVRHDDEPSPAIATDERGSGPTAKARTRGTSDDAPTAVRDGGASNHRPRASRRATRADSRV